MNGDVFGVVQGENIVNIVFVTIVVQRSMCCGVFCNAVGGVGYIVVSKIYYQLNLLPSPFIFYFLFFIIYFSLFVFYYLNI
jgi:predicted secreted protein